jgi:amino-acid N-acetyltransferase
MSISSESHPADMQVSLVDDIAMLQGMGVRLVLVLGAQPQIDRYLRQRGREPQFVSGYEPARRVSAGAAVWNAEL